jgi:hypothetical protein
VTLPSGRRYWTVLDQDLHVVAVADDFLRHQRFGRDGAESTTKAYAHAIGLFLRWCARTGRGWQAGVEQFGLFMTWLAHAGPRASSGAAAGAGVGVVLVGPGAAPARSPSRINAVLTAVRGMVVHAVAAGQAPAGLVPVLYEVADDRDLPEPARGEDGRMAWRMRVRHRLREPETVVDRASDAEVVALLRASPAATTKSPCAQRNSPHDEHNRDHGLRRRRTVAIHRRRHLPRGRARAAGRHVTTRIRR